MLYTNNTIVHAYAKYNHARERICEYYTIIDSELNT